MFKQQIKWFCIASVFLGVSGFFNLATARCAENVNAEIQKIVDEDRALYDIPALQVSVLCPGDQSPRDFHSGSTTLDGAIPLRSSHLFQVGSETKSFIAAILLQLQDEHVLSLDDQVSKWLPAIRADWGLLTIRQLLNHTSGLYNYTDALETTYNETHEVDPTKQWTAESLLQLVDKIPPYFAPGQGWHYSNTNYVLAGMIIEVATGEPVGDVITKRLIQPLHLTNTDYMVDLYSETRLLKMAHGYSDRGYFEDEPKDVTMYTNSWANAAGAINSNSHDIAIWFSHLMHGDVINARALDEMTTAVDLYSGQTLLSNATDAGYGLGVFKDVDLFNERAIWHLGGTLGYMSFMTWLPCSDLVVTADVDHLTTSYDVYLVTRDVVNYLQTTSPDKQYCMISHARHLTAKPAVLDFVKHDLSTIN